jgi:hypothetical protein
LEGQALRAIMKEFDREKKAFGAHKRGDIEIRLPHPLSEATIGNIVAGGVLRVSRYAQGHHCRTRQADKHL